MPGSSSDKAEPEDFSSVAAGGTDASGNPELLSDAEAAGSGVAAAPSLVGIAFPFRFLFTTEEFGRASAYHFSYQFRALFWPARAVGLFLIFSVAMAWGHNPPGLSIWAGLIQLVSGIVMLTYVQLLVWTSLRSFRKSRLNGLLMSVIVRGDGLHIRTGTDTTSTRHVPWERFTSAVFFPGGVVLYQTKGTFHWLPYAGMLSPAKSTAADTAGTSPDPNVSPAEATAAAVDELAAVSTNPTQLLEDFLRLHVSKIARM
jgi:hypothetical protein